LVDPGRNRFPYKIGYDLSGVVAAVGTAVLNFKPGDEVYSRVPQHLRGSIAEYALSTASTTALKPKSLSFGEAASIPLAGQTALQVLYRGEEETKGGLKGKTVFIPGGLSGTGSFGVQLAKNVFGAGKVITTLSTGKIEKAKTLLGDGVPDQIVDYTKEDVVKAVGKGNVDFMFDPVGGTLAALPLMKKGSWIISISTLPSGKLMKEMQPDVVWFLKAILDVVNWFYERWTGWKGVNYSYLHLRGNTADLDKLARWVDEGKVRPVVGMEVKLGDIEGVRKGCQQIFDGKGGVGKLVIDID
jgi:NADPH:quinone reductase-like Zn-dependent oxidoreductase